MIDRLYGGFLAIGYALAAGFDWLAGAVVWTLDNPGIVIGAWVLVAIVGLILAILSGRV